MNTSVQRHNRIQGSIFDPLDPNISKDEKLKFLVSDTYCKLLTDFAKGITGDMQSRVVILPPFSSSIAYADGHAYFVCTAHQLFINEDIKTITKYILAIAFHEYCHGMYTDFVYWTTRIKRMHEKAELYKWIFNSICDARIERIGGIKFPGIKQFLVDFRKFFFHHDSDTEIHDEPTKLLNNILLFATVGKIKYDMSDEMLAIFEKCRPHIIAGRRSDTTRECDYYVEKIFDLVYPVIPKQQTLTPPPTGMPTATTNGENFESNANTGGTDTITYDEDTSNETSSNKDESNPNTKNTTSSNATSKDNSDKSKSSGSTNSEETASESNKTNSSSCTSDDSSSDDADDNSPNSQSNVSSDNASDTNDTPDTNSGDNVSNQKDANASSKNGTLDDLSHDIANELIENALKDAIPSYEKENKVKASDEETMQKLSRDTAYSCSVSCVTPNPANAVLYAEIVQKSLPIIKQLITRMRKVINWNQDEVCHRQDKGFLDKKSLPYIPQGTCFGRKIEKTEESDLFISMLLDCSGSMHGQRCMNTAVTATIILEACSALNIPVSIKGFTSGRSNCEITHFWDYSFKNKNLHQNLVQIFASSSTPLAEALQYERQYLSSVKQQDKICFIITDGQPDNTISAKTQFQLLCRDTLAYGVAIGDDIPSLQSVFGENHFIDARQLSTLPIQIGNIIKNNLLK